MYAAHTNRRMTSKLRESPSTVMLSDGPRATVMSYVNRFAQRRSSHTPQSRGHERSADSELSIKPHHTTSLRHKHLHLTETGPNENKEKPFHRSMMLLTLLFISTGNVYLSFSVFRMILRDVLSEVFSSCR